MPSCDGSGKCSRNCNTSENSREMKVLQAEVAELCRRVNAHISQAEKRDAELRRLVMELAKAKGGETESKIASAVERGGTAQDAKRGGKAAPKARAEAKAPSAERRAKAQRPGAHVEAAFKSHIAAGIGTGKKKKDEPDAYGMVKQIQLRRMTQQIDSDFDEALSDAIMHESDDEFMGNGLFDLNGNFSL